MVDLAALSLKLDARMSSHGLFKYRSAGALGDQLVFEFCASDGTKPVDAIKAKAAEPIFDACRAATIEYVRPPSKAHCGCRCEDMARPLAQRPPRRRSAPLARCGDFLRSWPANNAAR